MPTIDTERDDWSIHIRTDLGPEPVVEVRSEHIARADDGARIVIKGLPLLSAPLSRLADAPLTLPDGRTTTIGAVIAALRGQCSRAIDALECTDHHDGKPCCLRAHLDVAAAAEAEAFTTPDSSTNDAPNDAADAAPAANDTIEVAQ